MKIAAALTQSSCNRLDSELLLAHVLHVDRAYLCAHSQDELAAVDYQSYQELVQRRQQGEPVAYLTGHQEFWSLDLRVNSSVLIPRPETELIVETALSLFPQETLVTLADLGTGSGAIALALAVERPKWTIVAADSSLAALSVAQENAQCLAINHVEFVAVDWCQGLPKLEYNVIVSNPPYLAPDDPHLVALRYEPLSALVTASQGLAAFEIIMQQARHCLVDQGVLLFEHGFNQGESVRELFHQYGYTNSITVIDLAGLPRVTYATKATV